MPSASSDAAYLAVLDRSNLQELKANAVSPKLALEPIRVKSLPMR